MSIQYLSNSLCTKGNESNAFLNENKYYWILNKYNKIAFWQKKKTAKTTNK